MYLGELRTNSYRARYVCYQWFPARYDLSAAPLARRVFHSSIHPNGKEIYSARIIPYPRELGQFTTDINDIMFVHIDSRRKLHATALLRAMGFRATRKYWKLFYKINDASLAGKKAEAVVGHFSGQTVVDTETGEIVFNAGETVTEAHLTRLAEIENKN